MGAPVERSSFAASEEGWGSGLLRTIASAFRLLRSLRGGGRCRQSESLDHPIVQRRPHLGDFVIFPCGIHAIGQHHNKKLAVRIDPNRGAGKTGMPEAVWRKVVPARAALGRYHPAERPRPP